MISFAQNFEDVMLERVFRSRDTGFYIDVGAWDPVIDSVTAHFYSKGWSGINVEPQRDAYEALVRARPRDVNLDVALGGEPGTATFYDLVGTGLSTLVRAFSESDSPAVREVSARQVRVTTLRLLCEEYGVSDIDFLKIDVEGWEREVIAGGDWSRYRPRVVLVEATEPNSPVQSHDAWEPLLVEVGYHFVYFDGLNRFYLREEDRDLGVHFESPPNVFDPIMLSATHRLSSSRDEFEALARETASLHRRVAELTAEAEARENRIAELEAACAEREARIGRLQASTSWRATAPLRAAAATLQRLRIRSR